MVWVVVTVVLDVAVVLTVVLAVVVGVVKHVIGVGADPAIFSMHMLQARGHALHARMPYASDRPHLASGFFATQLQVPMPSIDVSIATKYGSSRQGHSPGLSPPPHAQHTVVAESGEPYFAVPSTAQLSVPQYHCLALEANQSHP